MFAGPIDYDDSTKTEVMGLLIGLREIKKLGLHSDVLVEGDFKVVVGWGSVSSKGA